MARRFSSIDAQDLTWYFAGGLALEAAPPSAHGAMVDVLMRGSGASGGAMPEAPDLSKQYLRERQVMRRLAACALQDPASVDVLRAAFGPAPGTLSKQACEAALEGWGAYPLVLLISPAARYRWQTSQTKTQFLEWLVKLRDKEDLRSLRWRTEILAEGARMLAAATAVWERC